MSGQRARVVRAHRTRYADPIHIAAGEVVALGACDAQWPDFAWTTTADGNAGWAPVHWLQPMGDGRARALRDYDARELEADPGEPLRLHQGYGGWRWATREDARAGWIPESCIETEPGRPDELAEAWVRYHACGGAGHAASEPFEPVVFELMDAARSDPETLWNAILAIRQHPDSAPCLGDLAAGPLEDLIEGHGPAFIDRIEALAARDAGFAALLRGVWRSSTDAIWARVQGDRDASQGAPIRGPRPPSDTHRIPKDSP